MMSWASTDPRDTFKAHRNMIWKQQRKRSLSHKWLFTGTSPKHWLNKGETLTQLIITSNRLLYQQYFPKHLFS